jgi:hypothetical protein
VNFLDSARRQLGQPGGDIAANPDHAAIGAVVEQLRGAARSTGADPRARRQVRNTGRADQHIGDILTREHRGKRDFGRAQCFDILG